MPKTPELVSGGECEIVEMSSRMSSVTLVSRSKIGDGSIRLGEGKNSSSSSLVVDPEQMGTLWRRAADAKGFRRAWRFDLGVAEICCLNEDFLIGGTGYNTGFSSSMGGGWESRRMWKG